MTDKEIIKALECCIDTKSRCAECPYNKCNGNCRERNMKIDAFYLIKRQQEEIERFADIGKFYSEIRAEARAEAIIEFKEQLVDDIDRIYLTQCIPNSEYNNLVDLIDYIEKYEMVGDDNDL